MASKSYKYIIVGAGLAGASAVEGIREVDSEGSILLIGSEEHIPYHRPPLSKKLWLECAKTEDVFVHNRRFYSDNGVELRLGTEVVALDTAGHTLRDADGGRYRYEKLLLATGGTPRRLSIPGAELDGICYYRTLNDYRYVRDVAPPGSSAVIVGGGFIGSEMAAALHSNGVSVTMVFRDPYLCSRVFPLGLGSAIQEDYRRRGIRTLPLDAPDAFERIDSRLAVRTVNGHTVEADAVILGVGIEPADELARTGGLALTNGILVKDRLQTSHPDVFAAGDNAFHPQRALGQLGRVEHWDNASHMGRQAGRNMAGANEPYDYMPFFFSDLFDFGYEAVGEINPRLETFADWQEENRTGVIYYLNAGQVRGVMLCNVWEKVDAARELIRAGKRVTIDDLRGAIR